MAGDIDKAVQGYDPNATYDWNKNPNGFDLSLTENTNKDGKTVKEEDEVPSASNRYASLYKPATSSPVISKGEDDDGYVTKPKPVNRWVISPEKTTTATTDGTQDDEPQFSMEEFYKSLNKDPELTPEELKKLQRREKAEKAIAALGDIGASIANIVGTAKGAKNAASTTSLSGVYADKWNKWRQDYDANRNAYAQGLFKAKQQDYTNSITDRKQKREEARNNAWIQYQADNLALKRKKEERDAENDPLKREKIQEEIDKLEQETEWRRLLIAHPEIYLYGGAKYSADHRKPSGGSGSGKQAKYVIKGKTYTSVSQAYNAIVDEATDIWVDLKSRDPLRQPSQEDIVNEYIRKHGNK